MNKQEAIQAMMEGKKVRHRFFTSDEFIIMDKHWNIITEEGYSTPEANFWTDRISDAWERDWEIVTD